jgi:rhodanese-related sulfurtransferase
MGDPRVFMLHSFEDMSGILSAIRERGVRRAVIVGGGCIGLEAAENLARRGIITGVVEASDHVLPGLDYDIAQFAAREVEQHGVSLGLRTAVTALEDAGGQGLRVRLSQGPDAFADMVVIAAGVRPETTLARNAGLGIGITGGIIVDDHQQTTDKDIYAAGDGAEVEGIFSRALIPLASPAARQGHIAADNIGGAGLRYKNTLGVFAMRVFGLQAGSAGLTEAQLKSAGLRYEKVYTRSYSHAPYYPGASSLTLKLMFDKRTGRIYGVQIAGGTGVDKRLDVLATAMRAGLTADRLSELELCSAPPFGAAMDAVNIAGYVAQSVMQGQSDVLHWHHVPLSTRLLLDVRTKKEYEAGTLPGALSIPVEELRERISELPKGSRILCFSATGKRGYIAERILKQRGYNVKNLSGGFSLYQLFTQGGRNGS